MRYISQAAAFSTRIDWIKRQNTIRLGVMVIVIAAIAIGFTRTALTDV